VDIDRFDVVFFVALVSAIILHEIAHGVVALWFGDDTAKRAGRITLNPVPHVDPFGSLILPALGVLSGIPVIGWAKPVPVNPSRLRNSRRDMLVVSLAGPGTNFLLAGISAVVARALYHDTGEVIVHLSSMSLATAFALLFAVVNLFLGLFNFLPIPPLDGAAMIERALPERALAGWYRFRPYGILVLFLLVFMTDFTSRVFDPFLEELYDFVLR
jgi:Zn-dependent protease